MFDKCGVCGENYAYDEGMCEDCLAMRGRPIVELPLWPGGIRRRLRAQERKETYYHGFHDTPNALCRSCAWEQAI
jgi:hypothetical protein